MFPFISQIQLEKTLARAEEALNLVGYIPLVSILSATVRSMGGMLQALLGIAFALGYFFAGHIFKKAKALQKSRLSTHYLFHGLLNIIRAKIEAVPFLSLITCLPYDRLLKKRFKYPVENLPEEDEMEVDISEQG
jgi:hypothetical protein